MRIYFFASVSFADAWSQIQAVLAREQEIAKLHLANGQKDRALIALRQRKYQQSLLDKTDGQLETLEQLVYSSLSIISKF